MKNKQTYSLKGFTLIEIIVATSISVTLLAGVYLVQRIIADTQSVTWDSTIKVEIANKATAPIIKEIRTMRPSQDGRYPLETAESHEIVFYSDIDFDESVERVRYVLDGNVLRKGVTEPSGSPIGYNQEDEELTIISDTIQNESNPVFYYYNEDWPSNNNPLNYPAPTSEVKVVKVMLKIGSSLEDNQPYEVEAFTNIRMLKENL